MQTPAGEASARPVASTRLTLWSLGALATGLGVGTALHGSELTWVADVARMLTPLGSLWVRLLDLLVIPLIISLSVLAALDTPGIGKLGARSILVFAAMLVGAALLTCLLAPAIVRFYRADAASIAALRVGTAIPNDALAANSNVGTGVWLRGSLPSSIDSVLRGARVLVLLIGAMLAALLARQLARTCLTRVRRGVEWVADLTRRMVRWILLVSPAGILALGFSFGLRAGQHVVGFVLAAVLIVAGTLLLFTALLYPLAAIAGKTSLRRFARAAAPAQLVAMSTQSSLASLPALVEGARDQLALPVSSTGFVLPLAVSVFKLNRTISGPTQLILLMHAFGLELDPVRLGLFVGASFLQSFITPGVPGASSPYFTLPLYVAAGAPVEGVVILATIDPLLDVFKTLTNVTGDLTAATIVGAPLRSKVPA
jgi:proton glutamate symport protein